ncbi:PREDICTED: facilitated trehalose transporter Tret1-like [Papilio xuthus]|uniref:Facilitated trehalose transporter Tret1-like n=1 Tax=Papilio xuthus TaxID=66420 RepID=A0AAJ7EJ98_PAPXU|nr:PREDICTED: facilitated trehalose transporter Tret1-like [Papilio xuthus]
MRPLDKELCETEPGDRYYNYRKDFRTALPQIIAVSVKNLLILGYGMTLGFPTILIPAVSQPQDGEILHLNNTQVSWISSINLIVVPLGCALSGVVTSPLGRRRAMQAVNLPFIIAWLLFYYSKTAVYLYAALFLTGLAGGLLEAPVLTYVAEITQPHLRGSLSATSSMCVILGVFTQFLFGTLMNWRTVALVNISFTIVAVIALFFIPESPHWLISRNRDDDARKSLQWLRGWTTEDEVDMELRDIQALFWIEEMVSYKYKWTANLSHYRERKFYVPFCLVSYSFFVGHFSGMTTLQTYAVSIFQALDAPLDKYRATLVLGAVQIAGAACCVLLVRFAGKRTLTLVSTAGAGVCCLLLSAYDIYIKMYSRPHVSISSNGVYLKTNSSLTAETIHIGYSWMPTTLLMLLAFITHTGIRLLPWILIGEVFSAQTRSGASGLASAMGYIFGFVTNKAYINMVDKLSIWGTYGFYGLICLTGCVVFALILPETEGKNLIDIENHFAGIKKLDNKVYRPKKRKTIPESKLSDIGGIQNRSYEPDTTSL